MAAHKNTKKRKLISCFSFAGCFGFSHEERDSNTSDKKLVKHETRTSLGRARARTVPISHPSLVDGSSREVLVVEEEDRLIVAPHIQSQQVSNKKVYDIFKKNKKLSKSNRSIDYIKFDKNNSAQQSSNTQLKMLQSVSLPPTRLKRENRDNDGGGEKSEKYDQLIDSEQLDPMVGASIMMVTLIVVLIWGKICAIVCTSVWFYIIPRFRASHYILNGKNLKNGLENIDVDSWENKRKVVLEGFLERF